MKTTARPYCNEDDYNRIRALLQEIYAISGPPFYCSVGDLDWWRFKYEDPDAAIATARLWQTADGKLAGVAWPEADGITLFAHPHHRNLDEEMLIWAESWRLEAGATELNPLKLIAWGLQTDGPRNSVLHRHGYARTDYHQHWHKMRSLNGPIPEISLPAGYSIRHVRGEEDVEQRVLVHRNAFTRTRVTPNTYRAIMNAPTYRPELDLVVVAPDGSFASFCIVWYDECNQMGVFEPVGCHSQHRRRGLTRTLMCEGLRQLKHLGATVVYVGAGGNNVAANTLYQSLGFRTVDYLYLWTKELRGA